MKKSNYKINLNLVSIILVALLGIYVLFIKNDKVAYVESSKILTEYKGAEESRKAYQAKAKVWQSNIDTLTSEIQNAIKKHEKNLVQMSSKEQELSKQLIFSKQKQLSEYQHAIQENAKQEDSKLTQKIVSEVNAFLLNYGKQEGYKIIFIANPTGTIAYAQEGLNITSKVIEALNKEYQPGKR